MWHERRCVNCMLPVPVCSVWGRNWLRTGCGRVFEIEGHCSSATGGEFAQVTRSWRVRTSVERIERAAEPQTRESWQGLRPVMAITVLNRISAARYRVQTEVRMLRGGGCQPPAAETANGGNQWVRRALVNAGNAKREV